MMTELRSWTFSSDAIFEELAKFIIKSAMIVDNNSDKESKILDWVKFFVEDGLEWMKPGRLFQGAVSSFSKTPLNNQNIDQKWKYRSKRKTSMV